MNLNLIEPLLKGSGWAIKTICKMSLADGGKRHTVAPFLGAGTNLCSSTMYMDGEEEEKERYCQVCILLGTT
jgi:hypothetical protein